MEIGRELDANQLFEFADRDGDFLAQCRRYLKRILPQNLDLHHRSNDYLHEHQRTDMNVAGAWYSQIEVVTKVSARGPD